MVFKKKKDKKDLQLRLSTLLCDATCLFLFIISAGSTKNIWSYFCMYFAQQGKSCILSYCLLVLCRLLEQELQRVQRNADIRDKELRQEIDELRTDNERQQKLIGQVGCCAKFSMKLCRFPHILTLIPHKV